MELTAVCVEEPQLAKQIMGVLPAKLLRPGMIVREPECGCLYRVIAPESKAAIKEFKEVCPYPLLKYLSVGEYCPHVDRLYGERLTTAHGGRTVGRIYPDWDAFEVVRTDKAETFPTILGLAREARRIGPTAEQIGSAYQTVVSKNFELAHQVKRTVWFSRNSLASIWRNRKGSGEVRPSEDAIPSEETIPGGISDTDIEASCLLESELARSYRLITSRLDRRINLYLEFRPFRIPDMLPFLETYPNGFWSILLHLRIRLNRMKTSSNVHARKLRGIGRGNR